MHKHIKSDGGAPGIGMLRRDEINPLRAMLWLSEMLLGRGCCRSDHSSRRVARPMNRLHQTWHASGVLAERLIFAAAVAESCR